MYTQSNERQKGNLKFPFGNLKMCSFLCLNSYSFRGSYFIHLAPSRLLKAQSSWAIQTLFSHLESHKPFGDAPRNVFIAY